MTDAAVYKKRNCRLCDSTDLETVVKLTPTPPGNHFVTADKLNERQDEYPLELDFCRNCAHIQLAHVVNPRILYQQNYSYVSGTSPVFVAHLRDCCEHIVRKYAPAKPGLVVDIGSNDGTALRFYQDAGYKVLGFDPAIEIAARATASGIETICEFFGRDVANKYAGVYGKASLINSHNACAHIDDLRGVLDGVRTLLAPDGVFVMEVGYLVDIVENMWFDTIYHEHVDFHSVAPLVPFFASVGLEIIAVERISPQGGSIRVISQHKGASRRPDASIAALVELEKARGLQKADTYRAFGDRVNRVGAELRELVMGLKKQGKTVAGYGAPTKATTLLTHFRMGDYLDFLVDDNPLKQNLYSPGLHIPVGSAELLYSRKPDYLVILAWNFAESIMKRNERYSKEVGRFIVPMPVPKIV